MLKSVPMCGLLNWKRCCGSVEEAERQPANTRAHPRSTKGRIQHMRMWKRTQRQGLSQEKGPAHRPAPEFTRAAPHLCLGDRENGFVLQDIVHAGHRRLQSAEGAEFHFRAIL